MDTVEVFDPAAGPSGAWSAATPMGARRDNAGSAVLDGELYVFGGRTRNADGATVNADARLHRGLRPRGRHLGTPRVDADRQAGDGGGNPGWARTADRGRAQGRRASAFAENEEYDPATDSWRRAAADAHAPPRSGGGHDR